MSSPKILIANRGEIALRIIRTARELDVPTVAIYTAVDADTPHVTQADEAYPIGDGLDPRAYLNIEAIVDIAVKSKSTMIAPGYGFLSENAAFAKAVQDAGIVFLGPTPFQMTSMGLKHEARAVAIKAGVPVVPGSDGVVEELEEAVRVAGRIGYPVLIKASGGGGGMGMEVCSNEQDVRDKFEATRAKGAALFKEPAVFIEKYIRKAKHVEVQIFGNGQGHVIHFGERECSVQRRHQKVIEEAPCPLFQTPRGQAARERMYRAAISLGQVIKYRSAGTVEFIVDGESPDCDFFFLELNARIQVEHAITEVVRPGLDLVELMIRQGMSHDQALSESELFQSRHEMADGHSIECRIYCENPKADFRPSPGRLHHVEWADIGERGRIDTWVKTGTLVSPHYDPMIAKVVVHGNTREEAIAKSIEVLSKSKISGPPNNRDYCMAIMRTEAFRNGSIHTSFLDSFSYSPPAIEIISPGLSTSVQDLPGRYVGAGIPRGGAADMPSFKAANVLVGNDPNLEGLEMTMIGAKILFHADATIAVTGAKMPVTIDKQPVAMWTSIQIKRGSVLNIGTASGPGLRSYLAIRGGFPNVAEYMGSKSTFAGASLGGYQGRTLLAGDLLDISPQSGADYTTRSVPEALWPQLSSAWQVEVLVSSQWGQEFLTSESMRSILDAKWTVTPASNRSGLRIDGPRIKWARADGGEGGSHPSNVIEDGYAVGALNINGDTPVLFGVDGPDMGGFACILAVARASLWKLGQMRPGDQIQFVLIDSASAKSLNGRYDDWLRGVLEGSASTRWSPASTVETSIQPVEQYESSMLVRDDVTIRQAGDEFIIFEVGEMCLDISSRVKVELWEREMRRKNIDGVIYFNTCIRSSLVHFDPTRISLDALAKIMLDTADALGPVEEVEMPVTIHRLPAVPDDPWTREAIEYYMKTARKEAVYLPSNCDYIARNNGLGENAVTDALFKTPWLVLARGFFVMLPFIIPLDPRHRVLAQKYNPSRIKTPEGAIGLAGVIGSIYPIESPGGYQLLGRTLTTFKPWAKDQCLVGNFDQIEFYPVGEQEFVELERSYKAGTFVPESRTSTFKMSEYLKMIEGLQGEVTAFKARQKAASAEVAKEEEVLFLKYLDAKAQEEKALASAQTPGEAVVSTGTAVVAPLSANVWKFHVNVGDIIKDDDQRVVELEAMKTSVWVTAGEDTVGKKVVSFTVKPGDSVDPGSVLLYLE